MRFFLDTEFTTDDPSTLALISIAVVGEDGSEFYAVSDAFDPAACSAWVVENVLPLLEPRDRWRSPADIRAGLEAFLGDRATEMWGYVPGYDWFLVHALYGGWSKLPEAWPWNCWDLKQWAMHLGVTELPEQTSRKHHALDDAHHDRVVYDFLAERAAARG